MKWCSYAASPSLPLPSEGKSSGSEDTLSTSGKPKGESFTQPGLTLGEGRGMGEDQLVILLTKRIHICFLHTEVLQTQNCCNLGAGVRGKTGDPQKCTFKFIWTLNPNNPTPSFSPRSLAQGHDLGRGVQGQGLNRGPSWMTFARPWNLP